MRIFALAILSVLFSMTAFADEIAPPDPHDFAILPWGTTVGDGKVFDDIRKCGFNLAGFVHPEDLEKAHNASLKAIVSEPKIHVDDSAAGLPVDEITSRVKAVAKRVGTHPALFGYYLRDEPPSSSFAGIGNWIKTFRELQPEALPYVNMLPNYIGEGTLKAWGFNDYEAFIEAFVQRANPTFLSYDHYALMDDGSLREGYFPNLEVMRRVALRHNLPFWNIVLGNAHFTYAEPSPAGLRFQAYTTLAYGARGLSYFTYFSPQIGNYRLAPIDQFGNHTATWDMIRNVNLQIHALAPTYIKLKSVNVFHHPDVPTGCRPTSESLHVKEVTGGRFVVGEFEDGEGRPYALVVNKDLHKSSPFEVKFKDPGRIMMVNAYTGENQPWEGENRWLAAGQGMLLWLRSEKAKP